MNKFLTLGLLVVAVLAGIMLFGGGDEDGDASHAGGLLETLRTAEEDIESIHSSRSDAQLSGPHEVVRVIDGDTVILHIDGIDERVRLIGIDAPETVHPEKPVECFGREASERAQRELTGTHVYLERDPTQDTRDAYDRLLGYIILKDGTNFNKLMIEEGYAEEFTFIYPYIYQDEFLSAERRARGAERGLWAPGVCDI